MKLLGFFSLLFLDVLWTLFPVSISRFLAHDSRVLQLEFIYFYCFCSFGARIYGQRNIYICLYIGIYMFRVGSVVRQFYSILFYFEWKVHKKRKNQEKVTRSFLLSLCEWKCRRNNLLFCPRKWRRRKGKAKDKRQHSILFCTKF